MIETLAKNLVNLKKEFVLAYDGTSQIQEIVPVYESESFPIVQRDLDLLHDFTSKNPIYYNSYEKTISEIPCIVYEGDINKYWLNSIQYGSSHAPFSPTWVMSAYVCSLLVKKLGYSEVVDIGSGDGRIAFCAKLLDMKSFSVEIDTSLVELQKLLTSILDFKPFCSDAILFDYSSLNLQHPVFFIGGLAQMGGTQLANGIFEKIDSPVKKNIGWVFAGTSSLKYTSDPKNEFGWGTLIEKNNLKTIHSISLPTSWTFHESDETHYIFAKSNE